MVVVIDFMVIYVDFWFFRLVNDFIVRFSFVGWDRYGLWEWGVCIYVCLWVCVYR